MMRGESMKQRKSNNFSRMGSERERERERDGETGTARKREGELKRHGRRLRVNRQR